MPLSAAINTSTRTATPRDKFQRCSIWLLFGLFALRFVFQWLDTFGGLTLPVPDSIELTLIFTAFAIMHATSQLGWKRALAFLTICAVVSWCFEAVGIATGLVYGPYHYGTQLGAKLGSVPVIIPLAWFMMVYASWVVARLLLHGTRDPSSPFGTAARVVISAMAMTTWDTVMDPGKALSGAWTWEEGGIYFGVPVHNFLGWLMTTLTIYTLTELSFRRFPKVHPIANSQLYAGLPALAYALIAVDNILIPGLPALRVVALFGMGFTALLAVMRLALVRPDDATW